MTIARIFGKSPFAPLHKHIQKVALCIDLLPSLFQAVEKHAKEKIEEISKKISQYEHEADLTKNDIRAHLPRSLFMAVDRSTLLNILALQDSIADKAEAVGILCTILPLEGYEKLKEAFVPFYTKNLEAFYLAKKILEEFGNLLESSFGGLEAEKVREIIDDLDESEHEADRLEHELIKKLYRMGDKMGYPSFQLWIKLIEQISYISNFGEKLGNQIRMILELK